MLKRPLPIGIEFYKDMIKKPYYYVDKTLMIKDIIDNSHYFEGTKILQAGDQYTCHM